MRLLFKGMHGEDVARWQLFLRGTNPYSEVIVSGEFDDITHEETKDFQEIYGLKLDGRVGGKTLARALDNDFYVFDEDADVDYQDTWGQHWPAPPDFSPLNYSERVKLFGRFSYKHTPIKGMPELITITDGWQSKNVKFFEIPQLENVQGAPRNCRVLLHQKVGDQIVQTFKDWEDAHLHNKVLGWAGSFVPRFVRGSRQTLSNHAHATAFDINVPWNLMGRTPALKGKKGSVRELVRIANNNGLYWGGHFKRPDGMHFEVARVL